MFLNYVAIVLLLLLMLMLSLLMLICHLCYTAHASEGICEWSWCPYIYKTIIVAYGLKKVQKQEL